MTRDPVYDDDLDLDQVGQAAAVFAAVIHDIDHHECSEPGVWELYYDDLGIEIERLQARIEQTEAAIGEARHLIRTVTRRAYARSLNTGADAGGDLR